MSRRLKDFAPTLKLLNRYSSAQKKRWLKRNLDNKLIVCLCECAKNLLRGNVPLSTKQRKALSKRKQALRKLSDKKISLKSKRRLIQTGGFLGALLGPIVSILGGLFGGNQ